MTFAGIVNLDTVKMEGQKGRNPSFLRVVFTSDNAFSAVDATGIILGIPRINVHNAGIDTQVATGTFTASGVVESHFHGAFRFEEMLPERIRTHPVAPVVAYKEEIQEHDCTDPPHYP